MRLRGLRAVAQYLGVEYDTARIYASRKRYPEFPAPVVARGRGAVSEWDSEDLDDWNETRPGKGGGQFRSDGSAAAHKSWKTRRANQGS